MSYTLQLLPPRADGNIRETARRDKEASQYVPVDPAREAIKLRIAKRLSALLPDIEVERAGYEGTASSAFRCFEINDLSDDSFGIQIQLFDDEACVTIPFWHEDERAESCFRQVWEILGAICSVAGYAVFDPQMDRALEDGEGPQAVIAAYATAMRRVSRDPELGGRKPAKPWWKKRR